jgi:hypothetical protein
LDFNVKEWMCFYSFIQSNINEDFINNLIFVIIKLLGGGPGCLPPGGGPGGLSPQGGGPGGLPPGGGFIPGILILMFDVPLKHRIDEVESLVLSNT